MTALQTIVKDAKALKAKYPKRFAKWTDYVKQASAIYASKHKGKSPVGKKKVGELKHKDTKSHNVNIRVVSGIGKTNLIKNKMVKKSAIKKSSSVKKSGTLKKIKEILLHDKKRLNHGYTLSKGKVRIGKVMCGTPKYHDADAAREIHLFGDNDYDLYRQQKRPILINLGKKYKKGTFKLELAAKLWRYYIDSVMKKYNKDFGSKGDKWYELLDTHDRNLLSFELAEDTLNEFNLGNFTEQ
jgi:hypothetical protein